MKKLLYIFDDINYLSGAKKVTEYQIKLLSDQYDISVFSLRKPNTDVLHTLSMVKFIGSKVWNNTEILALSLKEAIYSKKFSLRLKFMRIKYTILMRLKKDNRFMEKMLERSMVDEFNSFDIVCVVSESSKLRGTVSCLQHPKKIQWIHTDYALWSEFSDWTKKITANDEELYQKFDTIVTLSEKSKQGFLQRLTSLENKTVIIPNLIPAEEIIKKSQEPLNVILNHKIINIITVGRLDKEKAYDRIIDICKSLQNDGIQFQWYIIGNGPMMQHVQLRIKQEKLGNSIILLGFVVNPYPLIRNCDIFILLSEYEGNPVTINESLILKTPVIATEVGGIPEQLQYGKWGELLSGKEDVYVQIKNLLIKKDWLANQKIKLKGYKHDNQQILTSIKSIF